MPAPTGYSRPQIRLHWVVALLVILQLVLHEPMSQAWETAVESGVFAISPPVIGHFVSGLVIFVLAVWRLKLRRTRGAPPPPEGEAPALALLARLTHAGLYALLILMPISGALAWSLQAEAPAEVHELGKALLIALVALHVLGALYHRFILKSGVMERMTRPQQD